MELGTLSSIFIEEFTSAVQETGVYRHNGGLIKGPHYTPQYDSDVNIRGVSGGPELSLYDAERRSLR